MRTMRPLEGLDARVRMAVTTVESNLIKTCSTDCRLFWNERRPLRKPTVTTKHRLPATCFLKTNLLGTSCIPCSVH